MPALFAWSWESHSLFIKRAFYLYYLGCTLADSKQGLAVDEGVIMSVNRGHLDGRAPGRHGKTCTLTPILGT